MIPIVDTDRRLVGFIGRAAAGAAPDVPKYLNSPASELFDKSQLLYAPGEDRADLAPGAMPILVEGPMDRLAVRQAAKNLAVVGLAPLGTALTAAQAQQLTKTVGARRPVAVALDADPAGQQAAVRAWDRLTAAGCTNLLHVALPAGKDPATSSVPVVGNSCGTPFVAARPLAVAVADHKIAAVGPLNHWQQRLGVLRRLLADDLPKVSPDRIGPYLTHLAARLDLDHHEVTAAADRLSPTEETSRSPGHVVETLAAQTLTAKAYPTAPRLAAPRRTVPRQTPSPDTPTAYPTPTTSPHTDPTEGISS